MRDELLERCKVAARQAVENAPYRDYETYDDEGVVTRAQTYREFFENTWQGHWANEVFERAAEYAARAIIPIVQADQRERDAGIAEGTGLVNTANTGQALTPPVNVSPPQSATRIRPMRTHSIGFVVETGGYAEVLCYRWIDEVQGTRCRLHKGHDGPCKEQTDG